MAKCGTQLLSPAPQAWPLLSGREKHSKINTRGLCRDSPSKKQHLRVCQTAPLPLPRFASLRTSPQPQHHYGEAHD